MIGERPKPTQVTRLGRINSVERQTACQNEIAEHASNGNSFTLFQTTDSFSASNSPPPPIPGLLTGTWVRVGHELVCITEH
ncbi:MAG: hypothetical protein OXF88_03980 [Rhodobacteraceae bacterium]|nr:hypothetical protein [Paracoccaceae bacterium]MCY4141887.1 hypothetical protein [Paracoccaceae bacterium]